jgi:hypothetical protein
LAALGELRATRLLLSLVAQKLRRLLFCAKDLFAAATAGTMRYVVPDGMPISNAKHQSLQDDIFITVNPAVCMRQTKRTLRGFCHIR